jgi:hypothetical protein
MIAMPNLDARLNATSALGSTRPSLVLATLTLLVAVVMGSAGCSGPTSGVSPSSSTTPQTTTPTNQPGDDNTTVTTSDEEQPSRPDGSRALVAYFTRTGNTERAANIINDEVGGDLFRIETTDPYPDEYNEVVNQAQEEQQDNARPGLKTHIERMEDYDVVFVGYPVWWNDTPMAILTFLEEYDLSNKIVVHFAPMTVGVRRGVTTALPEPPSGRPCWKDIPAKVTTWIVRAAKSSHG